MNTTNTNSTIEYETHIILAGVFLTFIVNIYQTYIQQKHTLQCKSDECCTFDFEYTDSG